MDTTKEIEKPRKKLTGHELTYLDVRQAARDGRKAFEIFVVAGKLSLTK
jgi:hypothetical protein